MTLQELRFIIALAREKHFGKASESCFVSQPTLSIAVRKLEEELNVILFERDKNDVRITPLGKDILERAKRVLAEVDGIKQIAEFDKDQLNGTFKLGAIYTVGPYLLPPLITALHKLVPQMPIEIQEDYTANLREKLSAGELDAILISLPFTEKSVVTRTLYKEPFVVLMPADHPLTTYKMLPEKALSAYNILMLGEGHCFRDQIISSCPSCFTTSAARSKMKWHSVEGSSLETIRHMVASGMGLTILPVTAANTASYYQNRLVTRPLKASHPSRVIALAWRKNFPRIQAIETVLKAILQCHLPGVIFN
ncbi:MAG TPA: hydrogen peroxide-inducible genes activator [Gammaproteobacteria bacterium]|nr:hydrogen peroxide-inducible genes activator [Gammaproteobacteria bacterium]